MNQRKAGEDFYFLHKIIPFRSFARITDCSVYPSGRSSDRVPFGTGHAVNKSVHATCKTYYTYNPNIYIEIKVWIDTIKSASTENILQIDKLSRSIQDFLIREKFPSVNENFFKQFKTAQAYQEAIFRWFNGFRMLKLVHYLRDKDYINIQINLACQKLWQMLEGKTEVHSNFDWLMHYRNKEKSIDVNS